MLPGWRAESTLHYDFTPCGGGASSNGKRRLIRGEGFATRISSNVRPQDAGGGAPTIAAPREVMDIEVTNSPQLSVGGPPSVPSRISVVLVEEAKAGGTPRFGVSMCGSGYTVTGWSGEAG